MPVPTENEPNAEEDVDDVIDDNEMDEDVSFLLAEVLSAEQRKKIVRSLNEKGKRYSDLLDELKMTSGNLNYHLLRLKSKGLLVNIAGNYQLTRKGRDVWERLKQIL